MVLTCTPSVLPRSASALAKAAQAALTELPMVKAAIGMRPLVPPMVTTEPLDAQQRPGGAGQAHMGKNFTA